MRHRSKASKCHSMPSLQRNFDFDSPKLISVGGANSLKLCFSSSDIHGVLHGEGSNSLLLSRPRESSSRSGGCEVQLASKSRDFQNCHGRMNAGSRLADAAQIRVLACEPAHLSSAPFFFFFFAPYRLFQKQQLKVKVEHLLCRSDQKGLRSAARFFSK